MDLRPPAAVVLGALAGGVSVLAYNFVPIEGLLPINKVFFAGCCGLLTLWLAVSFT